MLDRKEVSRFVGDEFVQIYETVKEDTYLLVVLFQLYIREVSLFLWFYHVIHLAQQINEQYRLMVQIL